MNQEIIGKFISERRKAKKLTQQELAEKIGVSDRTIGNWENGRNMPDLFLFKPLCEILDITINELLSGKKLNKDEYQEKFEENIVNTIDYTNKKINKKNKFVAKILLFFGLGIIFTAFTIFPTDSSWGAIYSVLGTIISLIGFSTMNKSSSIFKKLLFNLCYFILIMTILLVLDYTNVRLNNVSPRFSKNVVTIGRMIYYDTFFYDVIRCDSNLSTESWHVEKNSKYDESSIRNYCNKLTNQRLENMIKRISNAGIKTIVISKETNVKNDGKRHVYSLNDMLYEVVDEVSDKEEIDNILKALSSAVYAQYVTAMARPGHNYLFQLYDNDVYTNLIAEFSISFINDGNERLQIVLSEEGNQILANYYN